MLFLLMKSKEQEQRWMSLSYQLVMPSFEMTVVGNCCRLLEVVR
jgi:hypothetical protein